MHWAVTPRQKYSSIHARGLQTTSALTPAQSLICWNWSNGIVM
jgi:hypothetical protein